MMEIGDRDWGWKQTAVDNELEFVRVFTECSVFDICIDQLDNVVTIVCIGIIVIYIFSQEMLSLLKVELFHLFVT